ncbi:MAG: FCD domain-containing protein, partial [Elioraea sp.]|nr:FCD domain-containing protein [Elioraea sp.]
GSAARAPLGTFADWMIFAAETGDETAFLRLDREFNLLCLAAARNEFAEAAMSLMHGLSRRFWYIHYREFGQLPQSARLHADVARAIAEGDQAAAAVASDRLIDFLEAFTRSTVTAAQ